MSREGVNPTMIRAHALRRLSIGIGLFGIFGASLSGCGGGSSGSSVVTPPPTGRAACDANPAHGDGRARWTVLIYLDASNNLQPFSLLNVAQMASAGSDSNINIVVQWKQTNAANINGCSLTDCAPSFTGTRRYLIRKHTAAEVNSLCGNLGDYTSCSRSEPTVLAADRL